MGHCTHCVSTCMCFMANYLFNQPFIHVNAYKSQFNVNNEIYWNKLSWMWF